MKYCGSSLQFESGGECGIQFSHFPWTQSPNNLDKANFGRLVS